MLSHVFSINENSFMYSIFFFKNANLHYFAQMVGNLKE